MKSLILLKTFTYLLNIPSTNSNLVTYLVLYKEDQATHTPSIPLSPPYSKTSFILLPHKHFHTSPSLLQNLSSQITTQHTYYNTSLSIIHYPFFPHSIILKYHHFAAHKHIIHLFLYFSCNTSLLRKQHNQCHNTKNNSNGSFFYI